LTCASVSVLSTKTTLVGPFAGDVPVGVGDCAVEGFSEALGLPVASDAVVDGGLDCVAAASDWARVSPGAAAVDDGDACCSGAAEFGAGELAKACAMTDAQIMGNKRTAAFTALLLPLAVYFGLRATLPFAAL